VPLEGGIFYAKEAYDTLGAEILAGRKTGDRFSIPEAKERTGLSRKYMLPLLNRMEKDGLLRREGDVRVVL
jgi:selenocysteine-specific elongation factor